MKSNISRIFYIAIATAALGACKAPAGETDHDEHHHSHAEGQSSIELTRAQINTVGIELVPATMRPMDNTLRASGVIEASPQSSASVSTLFPGVVKRINVTAGDRVTAGETLALIENADIIAIQRDYLEALNGSALAQTELERQRRLNEQGAGILKNLQQAESASDIARIKVDGLAAQLRSAGLSPAAVSAGEMTSLLPVKSPISGIVSKVEAVIGSYASASEPLFAVVDPDGLYALLYVYGSEIQDFHPGMKAEIVVNSLDSSAIEGEVVQINRTLDPATKAMTVRVALSGIKNAILAPGMTLTAYVPLATEESLTLPESAFYSAGGHDYVFMLISTHEHDGELVSEFEKMEVVRGVSHGGYGAFVTASGKPLEADAKFATQAFYLGSALSDHGEHNH